MCRYNIPSYTDYGTHSISRVLNLPPTLIKDLTKYVSYKYVSLGSDTRPTTPSGIPPWKYSNKHDLITKVLEG